MLRNTETVLELVLSVIMSGLPLPSTSAAEMHTGLLPVGKSTLVANELAVILPLVAVFLNTDKVLELRFAHAISILPSPSKSSVTTSLGKVPVVKLTIEASEAASMVPDVAVFLNTPTLLAPVLTTTMSGRLSPSRSETDRFIAPDPAAKSTLVAKEPVVSAPLTVVFLNTEMLDQKLLTTIISGFPSPSISATAMPFGTPPAAKFTLVAREAELIVPLVAVFRKTEILLPVELATTISSFPSPSRSATATLFGVPPAANSTLAANDPAVSVPAVEILR